MTRRAIRYTHSTCCSCGSSEQFPVEEEVSGRVVTQTIPPHCRACRALYAAGKLPPHPFWARTQRDPAALPAHLRWAASL